MLCFFSRTGSIDFLNGVPARKLPLLQRNDSPMNLLPSSHPISEKSIPKTGSKRLIRLTAALTLLAGALLAAHLGRQEVSLLGASGQAGAARPPELYLGGQPNAPIKIEVFSDFQCPHCRQFYFETLKPLIAKYGNANKVCVVYHDFPLPTHPLARRATLFALAAARLGKEPWVRVMDALYRDQDQWSKDGKIEVTLAKALESTELMRVKKLAADPAIDAAVVQEVNLAMSLNIRGTPTFFISSSKNPQQRIDQVIAYPALKDYIDHLLKR